MNEIQVWMILVLAVMLLAAALMVLLVRSHLAAVAAASVVSLGLALLFALLRAPDVAMTEAAVGTGLSSLILALALRRLGLWRLENTAPGRNLLHGRRREGPHA